MRTTLSIDDHAMGMAKRLAASRNCSLDKFVEEALRQVVACADAEAEHRKRVDLPESGEGGLQPGIDMDNSSDLLFVMEKRDDTYGR
jgi:hypothetical protein